MSRPDPNQDLESLIGDAVRGLPDRRAPRDLAARVLSTLAARAALPWWRTPFVAWPATARVAFVLVCLALGLLTVLLGRGQPVQTPDLVVQHAWDLIASVSGFFALFGRLVPDTWLYAALGIGGALYAALFGLGAIVYRLLYLPSLTVIDHENHVS